MFTSLIMFSFFFLRNKTELLGFIEFQQILNPVHCKSSTRGRIKVLVVTVFFMNIINIILASFFGQFNGHTPAEEFGPKYENWAAYLGDLYQTEG